MKSKPLYQRAQTSSKFLTGFTFIRLCDLISHWTRKKSLIRRHSKKIQMHGETLKYEGMKRTYRYAAMTEDAAQCSRWIFSEVVLIEGSSPQ
jgi:hypothetical protein